MAGIYCLNAYAYMGGGGVLDLHSYPFYEGDTGEMSILLKCALSTTVITLENEIPVNVSEYIFMLSNALTGRQVFSAIS